MRPDCPHHEQLMLRLALGELDALDETRAEQVRSSCRECADWWTAHQEGQAADIVARVVDEVFASFEPPKKRVRYEWLPLTAAAMLAIAIGVFRQEPVPQTSRSSSAVPASSVLAEEFFESASAMVDAGPTLVSLPFEEPLPGADLEGDVGMILGESHESGDFTGWSSHS